MDEISYGSDRGTGESWVKRVLRAVWLAVYRWFDRLLDWIEINWAIMRREAELFLGAGFLLLGLLNFQSDKYCDGNAADYLTCTQPSTYYYYGALEIFLILVGAVLILLWFQKRDRR